jgi:hypothetical protein
MGGQVRGGILKGVVPRVLIFENIFAYKSPKKLLSALLSRRRDRNIAFWKAQILKGG